MKQTAVEWLIEQIRSDQNQKALSAKEWMQIIEQAKQMEKEQIINSFIKGFAEGAVVGAVIFYKHQTAEQYYNETYKPNNK